MANTTRPDDREPLEHSCDICGNEFFEDDNAYGTTTGYMKEDGFYAGNDPWLTVACPICGDRLSDAVALISGAPDKYTPEVLKAAPRLLEACQSILKCCDEALNEEWDRSDEGFEAMRDELMAAINAATPATPKKKDE